MADVRRKHTADEGHGPNDPADAVKSRPDSDADETKFPRKNTEQNRDMQPGTMTREEVRERTHRGKE